MYEDEEVQIARSRGPPELPGPGGDTNGIGHQ